MGWAALRRAFSSNDIQGDLYVEVISFDHLSQYLESRVEKILYHAQEVIEANIHLYNPEWLVNNLGMPKDKKLFQEWLNDFRGESGSH